MSHAARHTLSNQRRRRPAHPVPGTDPVRTVLCVEDRAFGADDVADELSRHGVSVAFCRPSSSAAV